MENDLIREAEHDVGVFSSNRKGFGFIRPEDGSDDLFVAARNTATAFHKDKVRFEVIKEESEGSNREAKIIEILERNITHLVGTYTASEKFGFVKPDINNISSDIFIPGKKSMKAKTDDKVLIKIDSYGTVDKRPDGTVVEILGKKGDPGVDILSSIKAKGVITEFTPEALSEADMMPDTVGKDEIKGRVDFRDVLTVTIDGEETKDFDDAMSLVIEDGIYHVGIHIADVAHYVEEGSAMDKEAQERGTSVYPVDRVIPMIPEKLSTGICSLVQGEDRLTLSCLMDFDKDGNMIDRKICESVIRVDKRMTYPQVSEMLEAPDIYKDDAQRELMEMLLNVQRLTDMFRESKVRRGAVDFEFPEPEITLDEKGHPIDIKVRKRDAATRIIEEMMLKANETVAGIVALDDEWRGVPIVYRSHEAPDPDRVEFLQKLVQSLGYSFSVKPEDVKPADVQKLVDSAEGKKEEILITTMTLRSMKRAMYSTASKRVEDELEGETRLKPEGHFGLAAQYYCHFTSPIRRYPDLINHRIIKLKISGMLTEEKRARFKKILPDLAQHVCEAEHTAIETERDTNKIKMAEYMADRIGSEFDGVVSGLASWGIYVSLPNAIEGLIPVSSLEDGYYIFDEDHMILRRETGGREFHIGDNVKVQVTESNPELRIIDFALV